MTPLTIVIISHHAASLLNFRSAWIAELCASGNNILCLAPDYQEKEREAIRRLGAEPLDYSLRRTGMNPLRDLCDTFALAGLLRKWRPDVVFTFSTKPVIYGTLAAWMARVPRRVAMVEGAGYAFIDSDDSSPWRKRALKSVVTCLYRVALARAQRVIFLNRDDRQEFIARRMARADKSVVLGGIGVDFDSWPVAPTVTAPITFLLVARLLREKGILEYVKAARQVRKQYPGVRFILLGGLDTNPGGLPQAEVQSWVDEGILEWPGHVPVQPWMAQASVFVLPSYREGVPRSTQEAMAMGRPVITTDVPGCRETVQDGVNGYLVPARDDQALASAMCRFIQNPDSIAIMGAASRRMAQDRFDVRQVNARLSAWVLGESGS